MGVCSGKHLFGVIIFAMLGVTLALGQGIVTGSISGTVTDESGAVVAGATVHAVQVETNRAFNAVSSNAGVVSLPSLPPGTYTVTIAAKDFAAYEASNVAVLVAKDTSLGTVKLKVGPTTESVTVTESAPLVENTTDQISANFQTKEVTSIPLGNTYDSFALFLPGVATAGSGGFSNNNGAELAVNGQRSRSNNFQLDGQNNNDNTIGGPSIFFGNQDVISELQVISNYSAEYGRNMGGVVNYITKSGTNAFHGTAYEFNQNSEFDSLANQEKSPLFSGPNGNSFCAPGQKSTSTVPCDKPAVSKFIDNRFGGTIGGPIKKNRVWFFGSTNFERQRSAGSPVSSAPSLTPTSTGLQQLETAFPNSLGVQALKQFGPATVSKGNPIFSNIQNVPVTVGSVTVPIQFGSLTRFLPALFNDYEATGRVDTQISSKDRFFARYIFQQNINTNQAFFGPADTAAGQFVDVPGRSQQIGLDYTHTFTYNMLNQVRFSYSRAGFGFEGGAFPNCTRANLTNCPPEIFLLSATDLGFGQNLVFPQGRTINVYQLQDNASWVHGQHVIQFGGEYDKQRSPNVGLFFVNGLFVYPDFNSLIANSPLLSQVAYGPPVLRFKENDLAFYFQDDWRVKSNLTLNLGLRWEYNQQASNLLHDESVAQQTGPNHLWDQSLPLDRTTVAKAPNHYRNFGPVVGFAWTPRMLPRLFGKDDTVIRGGFRIAYDFAYYNLALNVGGSAPFTNLATFSQGLPNVATLTGANIAAALFPFAPKGDPGFATELQLAPNFRNPYSQQWNLGIQRRIGSKIAAEIRYVGNHDVGNFQEINGNPALLPLVQSGFSNLIPAGLTPCTDATQPGGAPDPSLGVPVGYANCTRSKVIEYANTAYSIYHGLQSQLRLQNWHGFTGQGSYTYSRVIDNASEAFSSGTGTVVAIAQNPFDVTKAERGQSNYNYPHVFGVLWSYDLPFGKNQAGLLGHALGGWQINSTYRYSSGQPYTVIQNATPGSLCDPTNFTGGTVDACRPILFNASAPFASVGQCTNPSAPGCGLMDVATGNSMPLSAAHWIINDPNAAQFFGSPFLGVGRNTERGQAISTANLGVFKNTKVSERLTVQFQAEAFNVFNTQWLGIPGVTVNGVTSGAFGTTKFNSNGGDTFAGNIVTDGIGRRRLQFGLKLIF